MSDKPRGRCPVCKFNGRLRKDGALYRHWEGFGDQPKPYNGAVPCSGWRRLPEEAVTDRECERCKGLGFLEDPTACADADHCDPTLDCPDCSGTGEVDIC